MISGCRSSLVPRPSGWNALTAKLGRRMRPKWMSEVDVNNSSNHDSSDHVATAIAWSFVAQSSAASAEPFRRSRYSYKPGVNAWPSCRCYSRLAWRIAYVLSCLQGIFRFPLRDYVAYQVVQTRPCPRARPSS